jgi:hypothetical protein
MSQIALGQQVMGQRVLQQEPAGAGPQGLEHVLVEPSMLPPKASTASGVIRSENIVGSSAPANSSGGRSANTSA